MRNIDGYMYDRLPRKIKKFIKEREADWQNWNDEQIIAWIHTELGSIYSYDPNYRYANNAEKFQVETDADKDRSYWNRLNRKFVTCIDLANIVEFILSDVFFINCRSVIDGSGPHKYNIVYLPKKILKLDLQEDLYNIKSSRKLEHFGSEKYYDGRNFYSYTSDEIDSLLSSINYKGIPYSNDLLDKHANKMNDLNVNLDKKLEIILLSTCLEYQQYLPQMDYCEKVELFKANISEYITQEDSLGRKRNFFTEESPISHHTIKKSGNYISCFNVQCDDGTQKHYINDGSSLKYNEISDLLYEQLLEQDELSAVYNDDLLER